MKAEASIIPYIFGLKLKEYRLEKDLTSQELADKTGLSISYLSEIEKGKKYPKTDKIMQLAKALDVPYDQLISLKVPKKLEPLIDLLQSSFFKEFPLDMFGMEAQKIIEVISQDPVKINSFIKAILQISKSYELNREKFYYAALRAYQELHHNYFEEWEIQALEFTQQHQIKLINWKKLKEISATYGIKIDEEKLQSMPKLTHVRSVFHESSGILYLQMQLSEAQKIFLMARELGFLHLNLQERPFETPPILPCTFQQILNNFKASYFAAALVVNRTSLVRWVKIFSSKDYWDEQSFIRAFSWFQCTPEMLMQRLTNILPMDFGVKNLFFLRFVSPQPNEFILTKELHINRQHQPYSNETGEHYCRRWISLSIHDLARKENRIITSLQISQYLDTSFKYLIISTAFPNISNSQETISITIGFLIDKQLTSKIKFLKQNLPQKIVHTTCERCRITDCSERAAPPSILQKEMESKLLNDQITQLLHI